MINGKKKLSEVDIQQIIDLKGTMRQVDIAKRFNISQGHVSNIYHGRSRRKDIR